jgi:hypothetical protein
MMRDTTPYLDRLVSLAHPDGGWGYAPGQSPHLEPTCLGLLALASRADTHKDTITKARAFLASSSSPDGSYRLTRGRNEAVWPTAYALFTLSALDAPKEEREKAVAALLRLKGRAPEADDDEDQEIHDIDLAIVGWPWAYNNFSWVEPTAWACLALRRAGYGQHSRVKDGQRLLLDRTFDDGGINYGNRHILGKALEPVPGPTSITLLALQGRQDEERVAASVRWLQKEDVLGDDVEHLCWARLALTSYRNLPGVPGMLHRLDGRITAAHETRPDYLRPAPMRDALTALALSADEYTPFDLRGHEPAAAATPPEAPAPRGPSLGERVGNVFLGIKVRALEVLKPLDPPFTSPR